MIKKTGRNLRPSVRLALILTLGLLAGCGGPSGKPVTVHPAEKGHPQFIRIVVDRGFKPDNIVAQAGQPLQLEFYRNEGFESCAKSLRIPELHIEKELENRVPYRVNVPAHPAGELRFACSMNMMKGRVVFQSQSSI